MEQAKKPVVIYIYIVSRLRSYVETSPPGLVQTVHTLGFTLWRPYPSNGGFLRAFFDAMDVSADAADGAERHCSLVGDALPRISDALPWTADRPRLLMSLKVSD